MNPTLTNLTRYLRDTLGIETAPIPWRCADNLPFHLRNTYTFHEIQLLDVPCLLMHDHGDTSQTPASIRKHLDLVGASWPGELVYVRETFTSYNRKRLIEHRVPFIIPGNQMYLPLLGIDLREHFRQARSVPHKFSPSTQALIIHLLLNGTRTAVFSPAEMAEQLGHSMLSAPTGPVVALGARNWAAVKQDLQGREIPFADPSAWEIQVWTYDPNLCAADNAVDRLSLYLSLKDDGDERVEEALEEMMKGLAW